jgi:hypothetical protein
MESHCREWCGSSALCAAQQVRRCAGERGAGAAGCCAQLKRSATAPHVFSRCHKVLDGYWCFWRRGGALCAAQRVRRCAGERGVGATGCCAQRKRSAAAPHVVPRCHEVLDGRLCVWWCGGALCAA